MAEQTKWSSSRVAHLRVAQQPPQSDQSSRSGTQQSRWAPTSSSTNSTKATVSSSGPSCSSWRDRANDSSAQSNISSSKWLKSSNTTARPNAGSGASRWASNPARSSPDRRDSPVSSLTETFRNTSINSKRSQAPSLHLDPSSCTALGLTPKAAPARNNGLQVRDPSRPLGGKSLDRLTLLASPSRGIDSSSTLSTDLSSQGSMDLTSPDVQEELREYISMRITAKAIPLLSSSPIPSLSLLDSRRYLTSQNNKEEELQQILLLVRKLREALVASKRMDGFAVEVYELSTHLSILCGDIPQLAATLPKLVLELYPHTLASASEQGDSQSQDVEELASLLGLQTAGKGEKRMRTVSLYLLQALCLSGRATRLGQYSGSDSVSVLKALHRGLREYRGLRATLWSVYDAQIQPELDFCDAVCHAFRDVDPFKLSVLLQPRTDEGYRVDGWQRLLLLQALPMTRRASWKIAIKTYMYLPISSRLVGLIQQTGVQQDETRNGDDGYLHELLLLGTNILPQTKGRVQEACKRDKINAPDAWDTDDASDDTANRQEEEQRLHDFLVTQLGTTLPSRLTTIKTGHALKLR